MEVNVVLLAGGKGSRLWPLSNDACPKQFIILENIGYSSFQFAVLEGLKLTAAHNIIISSNLSYKQNINSQLKALQLDPKKFQIIYEASSNNTGKAIYDICVQLQNANNDNLTYFLPTDHGKYESQSFLADSLSIIDQSKINIFGKDIKEISDKFGYIIAGKEIAKNYYRVDKFIEKSILPKATGEIYCNLGIYLAKPSILYKEFHNLHPDLSQQFSLFLSIDKIISEKSANLNVITIDFNWHDLGSISGLYQYYGSEEFSRGSVDMLEINKFNEQNSEFKLIYNKDKIKIMRTKI